MGQKLHRGRKLRAPFVITIAATSVVGAASGPGCGGSSSSHDGDQSATDGGVGGTGGAGGSNPVPDFGGGGNPPYFPPDTGGSGPGGGSGGIGVTGGFGGGTGGAPNTSPCPVVVPGPGSRCATEGQGCAYDVAAGPCSYAEQMGCQAGTWTLLSLTQTSAPDSHATCSFQLPPACPTTQPVEGTSCGGSESCGYAPGACDCSDAWREWTCGASGWHLTSLSEGSCKPATAQCPLSAPIPGSCCPAGARGRLSCHYDTDGCSGYDAWCLNDGTWSVQSVVCVDGGTVDASPDVVPDFDGSAPAADGG